MKAGTTTYAVPYAYSANPYTKAAATSNRGRFVERWSSNVARRKTKGNRFESRPQREIMMCQGQSESKTTPMRAVCRLVVSRKSTKNMGRAAMPASRNGNRADHTLSPNTPMKGAAT